MGQNSEISWTHHTANLWWGCVEVAPECDNCYAREWAKRYDRAKWGAHEPRLAIKGVWNDLDKMQRDAEKAGEIHRVFVGSMMDIGEKAQPVVNAKGEPLDITTTDLRMQLYGRINNGHYPNLLFLFLSKRPQNYPSIVPPSWLVTPPANVMFGATAGTRESYMSSTKALRLMPGRRFLSCEPLLEDLGQLDLAGIEWVIVGGESGSGSRPMHPDWARSIRDQCQAAGVAFHFKQHGEYEPVTPLYEGRDDSAENSRGDLHMVDTAGRVWGDRDGQPNDMRTYLMERVGKKRAGRLLDGRTWDDVPETTVPA